jgi:mannose-6-phosphate isomerase-like protein (cupin superfamily)
MSSPIEGVADPRYSRSGAVHVPAGDGTSRWFAGDIYTIKASAGSTNGSLGLVEATVPAGGGPVAHAHTRTDKAFYLLSGQLEILDGTRTFLAGAGDFVFNEDHGVQILPEANQNGQ